MSSNDRGESVVEFPVWYSQAIGSNLSVWASRMHVPVADDTDPGGFPTVTGTQIYVVGARPSNLEREMGSQSLGIGSFAVKPFTKLLETFFSIGRVDGPLEGVLGILAVSGRSK